MPYVISMLEVKLKMAVQYGKVWNGTGHGFTKCPITLLGLGLEMAFQHFQ